MTVCQGCGAELPPSRANLRKWCTDFCRKRTLYGTPCINCGGPTDGSRGPTGGSERCQSCRNEYQHETRYWTPERVIGELRAWAEELGSPPSSSLALKAGARVQTSVVQREFGSWTAGLLAAGLTPRGGGRPKRKIAA